MNWEDIRIEYETSNITLKELAEKHDIKLGTLKSRKSREGWSRDATTKKKGATSNKRMQPKKEPSLVIDNDNLTDNQKRFCLEYIKYFNATKAYQKAYGCSYHSAKAEGYKTLAKPCVKKEIERLKAEQQQALFLDGNSVIQKYIDIAFADITDFVTFGKKEVQAMGAFGPLEDENGDPIMVEINYVDLDESTNIDGTIITEVKKGKDGVSVKLADKMKALDKLSLYFDIFPDKFKREIESEKLKLAQRKVHGEDEEEFEDDGFLEALDGKEVVWDEEA
ncbi:terminase small subunit [Peribacillus frigoritolerans]|uniref:terminase small subunit n=1 Tax=Peribacillus frigoritolerans TaxID=450367 RepID=UPI003D00F78A